jgi:hypothetical protein
MSGELHVLPPIAVIYQKEVLESGILDPAPPLPAIDQAQIREVDQVFSAKKQEADKVAGLMGMYTGVMLLHDLAIEAFAPAPGELEEEELNKHPRLEPKGEQPEEI